MSDIIGRWTLVDPTVVVPSGTASISVSPASVTLAFGASQQFAAVAQLADGSATPDTFTWTCTGGTIDQTGKFVAGTTAGTFRVTATSKTDATLSGSVALTISGSTAGTKTLNSVTVSPSTVTVLTSATQQFSATAHYSDGSTANVTANATWSTTNGSVTGGLYTAPGSVGSATVTATYSSVSGNAAVTIASSTAPSTNPTANYPNRPAGGVRIIEESWLKMNSYGTTITSTGASDPNGLLCGQRTSWVGGNDSIGNESSTTGFVSPSLGELHKWPKGQAPGGGSGFWSHTELVNNKRGYKTWYEAEFFNLKGDGTGFEAPASGIWKCFGYWSISSTTAGKWDNAHVGALQPVGSVTKLASGNYYSSTYAVVWTTNLFVPGTVGRLDSNGALHVTVNHNMRIEWILICGTPDHTDSRVICYLTDLTAGLGPTKIIDGYCLLLTNKVVNTIDNSVPNGGIYRRHYDMIWGGGGPSSLSADMFKIMDHYYVEGQRPV